MQNSTAIGLMGHNDNDIEHSKFAWPWTFSCKIEKQKVRWCLKYKNKTEATGDAENGAQASNLAAAIRRHVEATRLKGNHA